MKPATPFVLGIVAMVVSVALVVWVQRGPDPAPGPPPGPGPDPAPVPPALRLKLVYLTMKNCPACAKMERQTLQDPAVAKVIADRFAFEKVGREDARFKATSFPTYIVLAADGRELQRAAGYCTPAEFLAWLDRAKNSGS